MSLKDILGSFSTEFEIKGHKVELHPLNLNDIADLIDTHAGVLKDVIDSGASISQIFSKAPEMAQAIIAKGLREDAKDVFELPVGIQLQLFERVIEISEISPEYLGKLIARLVSVLQTGMTSMGSLASGDLKSPLKEQSTVSSAAGIELKK